MVDDSDRDSYQNIAIQAARWGADQELEACVEWLDDDDDRSTLRAHRRPKPPSLRDQALVKIAAILNDPRKMLKSTLKDELEALELSRLALEQLDD